jgi:hypothetical protein
MSTHTTLASIVDRKHFSAIADAANTVLESARAFLDAARFGKGNPTTDVIYSEWEDGLHALRRCITSVKDFEDDRRNSFHLPKRYFSTTEETRAYAALRTIAKDVGEHPKAPHTAGELPPLPTEESVAHLADFVAAVEKLPRTATTKTVRLTKDERNKQVSDYLKKHKVRAAKGGLPIREVVQETEIPQTSVERTPAWTALQNELERKGLSRRPRRLKAQSYTAEMDAVVGDATLQDLVKEQESDYEPSPLDKGRRPKVRARKKF